MMASKWRVYYDNGGTFDQADGAPVNAPTEGFVCAVGYDESGDRYIMHGWDFYCWDIDAAQWWGCNQNGLHDRLRRNVLHAYKEGRTVTKTLWQKLMNAAHTDPDFPQ